MTQNSVQNHMSIEIKNPANRVHIVALVVNYDISNTIVLEMP